MHPKTLIKIYRRHLVECVQQWEGRVSDMEDGGSSALPLSLTLGEDARMKEEVSVDLLKVTHTITHLCETYLLDEEEDGMTSMATTGIVTADTVRYLRYNHIMDADAYLQTKMGDDMDMGTLLDMNQPEYYDPSSSDDAMGIGNSGQQMTPYWCLLRKLVLRGCLDEAWAVLSRHSACRRSSEIDRSSGGYVDPTVMEDNEAFALIQALLLSAPIPGGRNEDNDDGLELSSDEVEEQELLEGMPPDAYKQWDTHAQDVEFNIHAIMNLYKSWKSTVAEMIKINTPLRNLTRRLPMLKTCLWDVILNTAKSFQEDDVWAERLTAELIYVRPQICKEDVHIRATDHMESCSSLGHRDENMANVENILLQIMKGNAGAVIQALNIYGGGSSAALPAAMSALLCNLLVESGKIELSQLSFDIETELFLAASSAILSSFAMQNHNEVGVRLSSRLLHPHVIPENVRVTAEVAEMLCRHWPKSDAETQSLLEACKDAVSRGSRRMLDACDSLGFSRSTHYNRTGDVEKSVQFLLRGIEYASFFGSEMNDLAQASAFSRTICFRRLTSICANSTEHILSQIYECFSAPAEEIDVSMLTNPLQAGRIIIDAVAADDVGHLVESDPSVSLLKHVVDVGLHLILGEKLEVATGIINCLKDQSDADGSIIVLAHSGLYGYLLSCAFDILIAEDTNSNLASASSSFDLKGMQLLFSRYTQYCSKEKVYINQDAASSLRPDITPNKMRVALGKGLMRSFVVQNAQVAKQSWSSSNDVDDDSSFTEQSVEQLLGPSL